jgi:formate dehydrogenase major subunit
VDCCARVCHAPSATALVEALGSGAATNSFADIERARTIFIVGCNPTENHPIVGARIRQVARRGANLIVIDPRATELAGQATLHLAARPGTTIPLLNAMAFTIVEEGLWDREWVEARCESFEEFAESVRKWRPEDIAELCGLEAAQIRAAARLYATARPAMSFHGLGVTEHTQGTEAVTCLVNLALLTGNLGRAGSGVNPLRGQNNVQGAVHMGCEPAHLTGYADLEAHRALFEHAWGASLPSTRGANLLDMMDAAAVGRLKALYVVGYDVLVSNPTVSRTRQAMGSLDVVIVQDMFLNETAKEFATVFLPATSSFEKDGTFMNSERRIQRVRSAIQPVGNSLPDWQIVCRLAQAMGQQSSFDFVSPEAIWEEIRRVWPAGAGITYKRLDHAGLQWPCPTENHPGTAVLHADQFPIGKRAVLRSIEYLPTTEQVQPDFPLLLITGRSLYQFNAGTMSMRTPNRQLRPTDLLDISVEDARRFGVCNGDEVRVISRYGEVVLPVYVTDSIRPGEVFATFQDPRRMLNLSTSPYRDSRTSTPQYKMTAVRIERPNRG